MCDDFIQFLDCLTLKKFFFYMEIEYEHRFLRVLNTDSLKQKLRELSICLRAMT